MPFRAYREGILAGTDGNGGTRVTRVTGVLDNLVTWFAYVRAYREGIPAGII